MLKEKHQQWGVPRELLEVAHTKMNSYVDAKRTEREFKVGDWVYLRLQPYKQDTVALRKNLKVATKLFGRYEVLERIGFVAYELAMSDNSRVHTVFHVSQLKRFVAQAKLQSQLPQVNATGDFDLRPLKKLEQSNLIGNHKVVYQIMVQ